jgi:hypothetical protein
MTSQLSLPEKFKIVNIAPSATGTGVVYDAVCCKTAHKVWFIITQLYVADTDITFSLVEGTDVAMGTTSAVTKAFPVWYNADVAAATTGAAATTEIDGLTLITSGASHEFDTSAGKSQMCIIEWDPAKHTSGYDCIQVADAGGNASNYVTGIAIVETRFPGANPPSVVID